MTNAELDSIRGTATGQMVRALIALGACTDAVRRAARAPTPTIAWRRCPRWEWTWWVQCHSVWTCEDLLRLGWKLYWKFHDAIPSRHRTAGNAIMSRFNGRRLSVDGVDPRHAIRLDEAMDVLAHVHGPAHWTPAAHYAAGVIWFCRARLHGNGEGAFDCIQGDIFNAIDSYALAVLRRRRLTSDTNSSPRIARLVRLGARRPPLGRVLKRARESGGWGEATWYHVQQRLLDRRAARARSR